MKKYTILITPINKTEKPYTTLMNLIDLIGPWNSIKEIEMLLSGKSRK
jgi:hypothetical protein